MAPISAGSARSGHLQSVHTCKKPIEIKCTKPIPQQENDVDSECDAGKAVNLRFLQIHRKEWQTTYRTFEILNCFKER